MSADPALDLVVAYLRLNGYFLLTEQDLHVREPTGYRSLTDIDIIALRPCTQRPSTTSSTNSSPKEPAPQPPPESG